MSRRPAATRRRGGHARPPAAAVHRRLVGRLPRAGRLTAVLLLALFAGGVVTLLNGPWLRVERVVYAGQHYTSEAQLGAVVDAVRGTSLLSVDSERLSGELGGLPAVAAVQVETVMPGELRVSLREKQPAFVWLTPSRKLVGAADGAVFAELGRDAEAPDLAALPVIDDRRAASDAFRIGDRIDAEELRIALRALQLDPAVAGSEAAGFTIRIVDEYGLVLVADQPAWHAALGVYGLDPAATPVSDDALLDQQVAAIRTLFATTRELNVSWIDVRNPGKVYWAP
jgi:POTRA domain, FtsQ-type